MLIRAPADKEGKIIFYKGRVKKIVSRGRENEEFLAQSKSNIYYNAVTETEQIKKDCLFLAPGTDIIVLGKIKRILRRIPYKCRCCGDNFKIPVYMNMVFPDVIHINLEKELEQIRGEKL